MIYGDDYSLNRLRNDIVGGVLGAAGGRLGEELVGIGLAAREAGLAAKEARAAAYFAERIAIPVADAAAGAAAKVGIGTTIAKEAASQLGSTAGQSLATGENQFTFENLVQSVWMSGAGKLGRKIFGRSTPKSLAQAPRGEELMPAAVKPAPTSAIPAAPAAETALPGSVPLAPAARPAMPAAGPAEIPTPPVSQPAAAPASAHRCRSPRRPAARRHVDSGRRRRQAGPGRRTPRAAAASRLGRASRFHLHSRGASGCDPGESLGCASACSGDRGRTGGTLISVCPLSQVKAVRRSMTRLWSMSRALTFELGQVQPNSTRSNRFRPSSGARTR